MDLVTIGGIIGVVVIVIATCAVIFKLLSRETTFEEVFFKKKLKYIILCFNFPGLWRQRT